MLKKISQDTFFFYQIDGLIKFYIIVLNSNIIKQVVFNWVLKVSRQKQRRQQKCIPGGNKVTEFMFPGTAVKNYHKLQGVNLFSHSFGGYESKIKVSTPFEVSSEKSFFAPSSFWWVQEFLGVLDW